MPIRFNCSKCQTRIRVPDGAAGKTVKCPSCGAKRKVPGEAETAGSRTAAAASVKAAALTKPASLRDESASPAPDATSDERGDSDRRTTVEQAGSDAVAESVQADAQVDAAGEVSDLQDQEAAAPVAAEDAVAVAPATVTVAVSPKSDKRRPSISMSASTEHRAAGPGARPAAAPRRVQVLHVCAWLMWAMSVSAILVAVALVIWHPINLTHDARYDRRLLLVGGIVIAALFWTGAELLSAARRKTTK